MLKNLKQSMLILMALLALILNSCMPDIEQIPAEIYQNLEEGKYLTFDEIIQNCNEQKDFQKEIGISYDDDNSFFKHCAEYDKLLEAAKDAQDLFNLTMDQIKSADIPADKEILNTSLMLAATIGDLQALNQLLKMGADPNAENILHMTALMSAANNIHPECVDALLKAGANPNVQDTMGATALMLASRNRLNYQSVRLLIKGGADVNIRTEIGASALIIAAENGCTQCMYDLIKAGADVNATESTDDLTPLLIAGYGFDPVSIKLLIDAGADLNVKTKEEGFTPLHYAILRGSEGALFLLEAGANPNVTTNHGITPYSILKNNDCINHCEEDKEIFKALIAAKARRLFFF